MNVTVVKTPNSKFGEYAAYYGAWPSATLRQRGWENIFYVRNATKEETDEAEKSMRYVGYRFKTLAALVESESAKRFDVYRLRYKHLESLGIEFMYEFGGGNEPITD